VRRQRTAGLSRSRSSRATRARRRSTRSGRAAAWSNTRCALATKWRPSATWARRTSPRGRRRGRRPRLTRREENRRMNRAVDYAGLLRVARRLSGQELRTGAARARFTVEVRQGREGDVIYFTPASSGKQRRLESDCLAVLDRYNRTGSLRPRDYTSLTQNASYLLALIRHL
jgi:hypothetical protein